MVSTHQADKCILVANLHFRISFWLTAVTRLASQCRMQPTTCRTTSRAKRGRDTWSADVAVIEGSLEVKLPTYEKMQQQWWEQSGKRKKQKRSRRRKRVRRKINHCLYWGNRFGQLHLHSLLHYLFCHKVPIRMRNACFQGLRPCFETCCGWRHHHGLASSLRVLHNFRSSLLDQKTVR